VGSSFSNNTSGFGGAVVNRGVMELDNSMLYSNSCPNANSAGGAIYNDSGSYGYGTLRLQNCVLNSNSTPSKSARGGGLYNSGTATVIDTTFEHNATAIDGSCEGGGIDNHGTLHVQCCEFFANGSGYGGAISTGSNTGTASVLFCTMTGNIAAANGGGGALYVDQYASPVTLTDDVLWADTTPSNNEIDNNASLSVTYSDVMLGYSGTGNIKSDPLFANAATGNLGLKQMSPCNGTGIAIPGIATDITGYTRPNPPSIGAYEFQRTASSTLLTTSATPTNVAQAVTLTATVTGTGGTPTGTVTFLDGSVSLGTSTLASGSTTFTTAKLSAGAHSITAQYVGDTIFLGSTSSAISQVVQQAASTTTLVGSPNPSISGQSVILTATVTGAGAIPTGAVTFLDGTTSIGTGTLASGSATINTAALAVGKHNITASYSGNINFSASASSVLPLVVNAAPPTSPTGITAAAGNAVVSVTWTASVGATAYNLYRALSSGGEGTTPYLTGITTASYVNTGLTNGITYYYKVAAVGSGGTSTLSSEAAATPSSPAASSVCASPGNARIDLNWSAIAGATSYAIYQSTASGAEGTTALATNLTALTYTDTAVTNGKAYFYQVVGTTPAGATPRTSEVFASPAATSGAAGTGISIAIQSSTTNAVLLWTITDGRRSPPYQGPDTR